MISAVKPLQRDTSSHYERLGAGVSPLELQTFPRLLTNQELQESGFVPDGLNYTAPPARPAEVGDHRLLEPQEERALTRQVLEQKQHCESLIFQSPSIIQLALHELRTLSAPTSKKRAKDSNEPEKKRAYEVILFDRDISKPTGGEAGAIKRVTLNLKTVERLVARIESLVSIITDPAVPTIERKRAKLECDVRRERIATLLIECRFRRAAFKCFESEFKKQAQEAPNRALSEAQHFATFWESQNDLADRLKKVTTHSDLYEQARNQLVSYNQRLVRKLAGERASDSMPFDDLFQSGITGLCEAIDLFEPDRGLKLSTYATYWILQKIQLCEKGLKDLIYRNARTEALCSSVSRFISDFVAAHDYQPSVQQIAKGLRMKEELVLSIRGILAPTGSIDYPLGGSDDGHRDISKYIRAPERDLPSEVDHSIEAGHLREALQSLPYRQRLCIELRHNLLSSDEKEKLRQQYGVSIGVDPSCGEIGKLFGVTNQRINQVYKEGLANLLSQLHGIPWISEDEVKAVIERFNALSRAAKPIRKA